MLHPILINAIKKHLTSSEITLLYNSHTQRNIIGLSQLHIASPQFFGFCCAIFNPHLDAVFIHYIKHRTWADFTRLYTQYRPYDTGYFNLSLAKILIQTRRPTQFLHYICTQQPPVLVPCFALYQHAASHNNIPALEILCNPAANGTTCDQWCNQTCYYAAVGGHLDTLIWLRDPTTGGGACPWDPHKCLQIARDYNHPHIITWIHTQLNNL